MEEYQQRVIEEARSLDAKRRALEEFLASDKLSTVDQAERDRLARQYVIMVQYSDVLHDRINHFK